MKAKTRLIALHFTQSRHKIRVSGGTSDNYFYQYSVLECVNDFEDHQYRKKLQNFETIFGFTEEPLPTVVTVQNNPVVLNAALFFEKKEKVEHEKESSRV